MTFREGTILCAECGDGEDEHCPTCLSCPREPTKECCMEGWPEAIKESERAYWASRKEDTL